MNTRASDIGSNRMTLLRAMAFPLHMSSVLFIAISSLILALITRGQGAALLMAILPIYTMMVWLTQFAFTMIDDVANGRREAATATVEMLSPFGDPRCWVHPALAALVAILLFWKPQIPQAPVLIAAWLLFPASIGALAVSSRVLDALNPVAMWQVIRGLGPYYLLLLAATLVAGAVGAWIAQADMWSVFRFALCELVLLEVYALIGGTLHLRRLELGFEPVSNPERELEQEESDRQLRRQQVFDDVYRKLRVRETPKAVAAAREWFESLPNVELQRDVAALLEASRSWSEPKAFGNFAQGLITQLLAARQPGLALATVEEATRQAPAFALAMESDAVELARYALQTGRRSTARALLENFIAKLKDQAPGADLLALRQQLGGGDAPQGSPGAS
jgi:hypothetical protein